MTFSCFTLLFNFYTPILHILPRIAQLKKGKDFAFMV